MRKLPQQVQKITQGFTLLELVVAMAIFAIMAAIAYSGLNNVLIARQQTEMHSEQLHQVQLAMSWLGRDIEQIVDRGVRNEYGEFLQPVVGNDFEGYLLEFTRGGWANPANQPRSQLQRVAYAVRDEQLVRVYWRSLDRAEDSKPYENILLDGVKGMEIRYLGADEEWRTSWPAEMPTAAGAIPELIPRAIEVNVDTKQFGKISRLLRVGR
ncbi:MAG: type II secretion system minor pseudopilin GspJ [Gammaproteobacteria bacterium]|nr:type II secretion system minor pseudopilin GspJ [Gammaproteobacteria bacterium]